jgi:nicotinamidase-related amidase
MSEKNLIQSALCVIDLQNDLIHSEGKLAACSKMAIETRLIENANTAIFAARSKGYPIIFIRVGFSANYAECSITSPLFTYIKQMQGLQLDTWGAELHQQLDIQPEDIIVTKHRVGAFYATSLPAILTAKQIQHLMLCGVSTDFAVQTIAREAHDRDYQVSVIQDACAASHREEHRNTLQLLEKFTKIITSKDL